jgi:hypothetical protein
MMTQATPKFLTQNGWTKKRMKEMVRKYVPRSRSGCMTPNGQCMYHICGDDGKERRCAAGCFIPSNSSALFLIGGVGKLFREFPEIARNFPLNEEGMIHLQASHDGSHTFKEERYIKDAQRRVIRWINLNVEDAS